MPFSRSTGHEFPELESLIGVIAGTNQSLAGMNVGWTQTSVPAIRPIFQDHPMIILL
jgi:hypothetical protein